MGRLHCNLSRAFIASLAGAMLLCASTGFAAPKRSTVIQDLHYGDVLFYFYQEDYFTAITRLLAAQEKNQLESHGDEAELLLGGLYLSYGQHDEAGEIFRVLLDENVTPEVRDQAWFFLAKIWYQRAYYAEAGDALGRIGDTLPKELVSEKRMLQAQVLMAQERFAEAAQILAEWRKRDDWVDYARYNLGVALVRLGEGELGVAYLDKVGTLESEEEEILSLRDQANLALGYAYIQLEQPELARAVLERVSLQGAFSSKALLGVGWADASLGAYERALVPWLELNGRNLFDSAVQESLLASPYAYGQLGAFAEATNGYQQAINVFSTEMRRLDESIDSIRNGLMTEQILAAQSDEAVGWFWTLDNVSDAPETRYLYELMADHEFQEALKNYRDLRYVQRNLQYWHTSIGAFDDMLENAKAAYAERLPRVDRYFETLDLDSAVAAHDDLANALLEIERTSESIGLATEHEHELWVQIQSMMKTANAYSGPDDLTEEQEKLRLMRGVLMWDINTDFHARLWSARKRFRDLHEMLEEAQQRNVSLQKARDGAEIRFAGYEQRIAALRGRVLNLRVQVDAIAKEEDKYLEYLAIRRLEDQKQRLNAYLVQARFALATIYDKASAGVTQ